MIDEDNPNGSTIETAKGTYKRKRITYVARRVIVKLAPPEGESSMDTAVDTVLAATEGARVLRPANQHGRMVLLIPEGQSVATCATRLSGSANVEYAEPDVVDHVQVVPTDPRYPQQWALPKVNAEDAWNLETGANNVVIGVIDSGISMSGGVLDHDDLSTAGRITLGTDFIDGGTPRDLNGHGTHVAGIAAAAGNNGAGIAGMNWNSPIYICRTLDANGSGSSADFADAVEEITDYAVANGLKAVINYSGGGGANLTKQNACQYASDNGMLLVAATGNDAGPVIWPAAYSTSITGVVAVGSTDSNDAVSSFSNVGPEVTVVAPGGSIHSTTPTYSVRPTLPVNYGTMSGTSMATPLVSGLAALMWSRHPGFTNEKIKTCLKDTAVELGSGSFHSSWGHGRVDALAALKCGDVVVLPVPTRIVTCTPRTRVVVDCFPATAICPTTRVSRCASRLPVACPTTRLRNCWSRLLCLEPRTVVTECRVTTRVCPSAVDACPSTPGGCVDPGGPIVQPDARVIGRLGNLEARLDAIEHEQWSDTTDDAQAADGGWFYVDDAGEIHEV